MRQLDVSCVVKGQHMSSAEQTIPDANRLYIGEGVTIKGEISVPDTLVVFGSVEGDVSVGNLIVGETGARVQQSREGQYHSHGLILRVYADAG